MAARLSASSGITSGTICPSSIPSSVPTINSRSVSDVIFSEYDRLSIKLLLNSRMSSRFCLVNSPPSFCTSTAT